MRFLLHMISLDNNCVLIEHASELPELPLRIDRLYLDLETTSGDRSVAALNPWKVEHCRAHLAAITWDDCGKIYGVPRGLLLPFIRDALHRARTWVNQNVKYDAHVCFNDLGIDENYRIEYRDTLTLAKLVDSDRTYKGGYGLDSTAKDYCGIDLSSYYASLVPWVGPRESKDYGDVPLPTLANYACNQVRANRVLHSKLEDLLPADVADVYATERRLTSTLVASERRGMRIDLLGVKKAKLRSLWRQLTLRKELEERLGYEFNPSSQPDCEDLFINRYGLPAIYSEKKGVRSKNPSFSKDVLKEYLMMEDAPVELIELVRECRHESTMTSLFWEAWLELAVQDSHGDWVLHSDNNQCVRSGRLSASTPNNMQLNDEARELVIPRDGFSFVVQDYSQIEYRFIIHYINNAAAIKAYNEDPETDFHQYMADRCHIDRKPAKIINLAVGFGMGKKKTVRSVEREKSVQEFTGGDRMAAKAIALNAYREYHTSLPELKHHAKLAENAARQNGFVRNAFGRRLHIPLEFARVGFNRAVQSHAADQIKNRVNAIDEIRQEHGAYIFAMVHDETASEVPTEEAEAYAARTTDILNVSPVPLRVPIRCSCGISDLNWMVAKHAGDKKPQKQEQLA